MSAAWLSVAVILFQSLRNEAYYLGFNEAVDPMYRLDYEEAIERLENLGRRFPHHPGPPLAQGAALWLRELFRRQELDDLDRFISPGYFTSPSSREMPPSEREAFESLLEQSETLARRVLEVSPGDLDALYYLGSAEGIRAAFAITVDRTKLEALRHGKRAYQYAKEVAQESPDYGEEVLSLEDVAGAHREAKHCIERPYRDAESSERDPDRPLEREPGGEAGSSPG